MNSLISAELLASQLGVTPRTVRDWARKGKIPCVRISPKVIRFNPEAVLRTFTHPAIPQGADHEQP